jgi:hypothetical protein
MKTALTCFIVLVSAALNLAYAEGPQFIDSPTVVQTSLAPGLARTGVCQDAKSAQIFLLPASVIVRITELLDEKDYDRLKISFNLRSATDLRRLKNEILAIRDLASHNQNVKISEESLYAYAEMYKLTSLALQTGSSASDREAALAQMYPLAFAINSQFLYPIPKSAWLVKALVLQANRGAFYSTPACDVQNSLADEGKNSPPNTTLWKNPSAVAARDLSLSPGYTRRLSLEGANCVYDRKHKGFGIHAGFYLKCYDSSGNTIFKDYKIKIKFGNETHSGPFNSRIYAALGYKAQQADYFTSLKIRYDRRIFTESNSSKKLESEIWSLLFGKVASIRLSGGLNPFDQVSGALLKNGTFISSAELPTKLLRNSTGLSQNIANYNYTQIREPSNFDQNFESQIDYLLLREGSFSLKKNKNNIELGAWDYNDPTNSGRRDMRGLVLLSAFLGNYDIRWDNTQLELIKTASGYELSQSLSDVGSGLGQASNLSFTNADPTAFPKRWLHAGPAGHAYDSNDPFDHDPAVEANGFRFLNYQPNLPNKTFENISRSDAQWMAGLIAQLRPEQFKAALQASGFSPAETEKFLEILLARQRNLTEALRLQR